MAICELYLGLGSNQGDKQSNLLEAIGKLDQLLYGTRVRVSDFIRTEPWGFVSEDDFLNAVVVYEIELPDDGREDALNGILDICKAVEESMGRQITGPEYDVEGKRRYKSRTMDIDILICGEEILDTERLTIPHPLMKQRDFVMIPLNQVISEEISRFINGTN